jgi:hypothetical protein
LIAWDPMSTPKSLFRLEKNIAAPELNDSFNFRNHA